MSFDFPAPAPAILMLHVHPSIESRMHSQELICVEPSLPIHDFTDQFGNRASRVTVPAGVLRIASDTLVSDSGNEDSVEWQATQHPIETLPDEVLPFLISSRYCEVDLLSDIAWNLFGSSPLGWARVQSICDWVHSRMTFSYPCARSTRTAFEAYNEGIGVCRDYQHLAIAFCRAMHIPARYATGYLGDIGVPYSPDPMDFSAWFEVYLQGAWHTFDARNNRPRIGRILMAVGRDAADVALMTSFGPAKLLSFKVWTDQVPEPWQPRQEAQAPPAPREKEARLAADYAAGRKDSSRLLSDLENAQLDLLSDEKE